MFKKKQKGSSEDLFEFPPPAPPKVRLENAMCPPIQRAPKKVDTSLADKLNNGTLTIEDLPLSDASASVDEESNSASPKVNNRDIKISRPSKQSEEYSNTEEESESDTPVLNRLTIKPKSIEPETIISYSSSRYDSASTSDDESTKKTEFQKEPEIILKSDFDIKQKLLEKEKEILNLKKEISDAKTKNKEYESRLKKIDEENSILKTQNQKYSINLKKINRESVELKTKNKEYESRLKKIDEDNSILKTQNQKYSNSLKKIEQENSELRKQIKSMQEDSIEKRKKVKKHALPVLETNEMKCYKKGKRIGRGATSEVYEIIKETKLAMKVLDLEMLNTNKRDDDDNKDESDEEENHKEIDIELARKFLQESEVLEELEDEHIIKTYGFFFGNEEEPPTIILEYCESNLKKRIKKLTKEERIQVIVDISSAMKKVHSKGIIHRDLKLENILLDANNSVKLSDFGLCTFIKNDDETMSHTAMSGTMKYMSPELLQGRRDYDEKVDVYAFGVVVFLILTKGEYPNISIGDVVNGKQATIPKNITEFSAQLIRDCWSFKSSERPSFTEICDKLKGNEYKLI